MCAEQKEERGQRGRKKKRVRDMRMREAEILAVAWHRATLIHCIAQSRWAIIRTQAWAISHTHPFPIFPGVPRSQPYCSTWCSILVQACSPF